jgi:AcrR family transcriptional regulator
VTIEKAPNAAAPSHSARVVERRDPLSEAKSRSARALASSRDEPARRPPGRPTLSNEQLLDRALDLFLERGFERTSIDAVAAAAGMAKRTVYLRYGDKLTLFKAALQRAIDDWIIPVERLRAIETDDLEETLLRIGERLIRNVMTPTGLRMLRITNAESGRMPEIGRYTYQRGTERTMEYLADLFRRRADGATVDADAAAFAFMNLVVAGLPVTAAWGVEMDRTTIERHTRYAVRLFLHGFLGAHAAEGEPALAAENERLRRLLVDALLRTSACGGRPRTAEAVCPKSGDKSSRLKRVSILR